MGGSSSKFGGHTFLALHVCAAGDASWTFAGGAGLLLYDLWRNTPTAERCAMQSGCVALFAACRFKQLPVLAPQAVAKHPI